MSTKKVDGCSTRFLSKGGQVTIFIIIGIILVFVFAAVLFFTNEAATTSLKSQGTILTSSTPQVFVPIQVYTENCLSQVSERGLRIMGEQGGYIYPDLIGEFSVNDPTESDGLFVEPQRIPYWHYNNEPNDANTITFASKRPALTEEQAVEEGSDVSLSMERQLANYVEEEISGCLQNYTVFGEQGYSIEMGALDVEVEIITSEVIVNLGLPLEMVRGDSEGRFDQFVVRHPVELPNMYKLAYNITVAQKEQHFLENTGLNLVQIYSGIDQEKLPPTSGTTFGTSNTIFWQVSDVKQKFQQMLFSNIPLMRFWSADNYYRYEYPTSDLSGLYQRTSDDMIIPLEGAANLDVRFDYWNWDVFLDINEGESLIKPSRTQFESPFGVIPFGFGFQDYDNTYDFSFPVRVSIDDTAALNGDGYSFIFALEGTVVNNRIGKEDRIEAPVVRGTQSLVCDRDTWSTEIVRSVVVDSHTKEPLELVNLGFKIPNQDYCLMGATDSRGVLESEYPAVIGGVIDFERRGYLTSFYPVDTYRFKEQQGIIGYAIADGTEPVVELHKVATKNVVVKKKELNKCINGRCPAQGLFGGGEEVFSYKPDGLDSRHAWFFSSVPRDLESNELGFIILERVGDTNEGRLQDDFTVTIPVTSSEPVEVDLVPGVYKVTSILVKEEQLVIPKQERCDGLDCVDFLRMELDQFQLGTLKWDTESTYLTITPEDLYNADEITFSILAYNLFGVPKRDRVIEDLTVLGELEEISRTLQPQLQPTYK